MLEQLWAPLGTKSQWRNSTGLLPCHWIIQSYYPKWLLPLPTTGNITCVQTRHVNSLHVKRSHADIEAWQMQSCGPMIWYQLPPETLNAFKIKLKEHLLYHQWHQVFINRKKHNFNVVPSVSCVSYIHMDWHHTTLLGTSLDREPASSIRYVECCKLVFVNWLH